MTPTPPPRTIADMLASAKADRETAGKATPGPWLVRGSRRDCDPLTVADFVDGDGDDEDAETRSSSFRARVTGVYIDIDRNAAHIAHNDPRRVTERAEDIERLAAMAERLAGGLRHEIKRAGDHGSECGCRACEPLRDFDAMRGKAG